jgi:hypothetical protein
MSGVSATFACLPKGKRESRMSSLLDNGFRALFRILRRGLIVPAVLALFTLPAPALEPVSFDEPPDTPAFNIQANGKTTSITLRQIEKLGVYRVVTPSPYEKGELTFEGVLFRDLLKFVGLEEVEEVTLRATDDYVQIVPREDWTAGPLLLATRQDGKLLTRRTQGPTRLVYPLNDYPPFDTPVHKPRWIWLIKAIEVGN